MKKMLLLLCLLSQFLWAQNSDSAPAVNSLAIFPFQLKGRVEEKSLNIELAQILKNRLASKQTYQIASLENLRQTLEKQELSLSQWYDFSSRQENLNKIASAYSYFIEGEIFAPEAGMLSISARLSEVRSGAILKSAAISGGKNKLQELARELAMRIMPSTEELLQKIAKRYQQAFERENYPRAVALCDWALQVQPKHWQYQYRRGQALAAQGAYLQAHEDYNKALRYKNESDPDIQSSMQKISDKVKSLKQEHTKLQEQAFALHQKLKEKGGALEKIQLLDKILSPLRKENPQANKFWQRVQKLQRMLEKLQAKLQQTQLSTPSQETNNSIIKLLKIAEKISQRTAEFTTKVTTQLADQSSVYSNRALQLLEEDKAQQALEEAEKALLLQKSPNNLLVKGLVLVELGEKEKANQAFSQAISQNPDFWQAHYQRALLAIEQENFEQAQQDLQKIRELQPSYALAYFQQGRIFQIQKKYEQAIASYNQALEKQKDLAQAYYHRGQVYDLQDKSLSAYYDYKKSYELSKDLRRELAPLIDKTREYLRKDAQIFLDLANNFLETGELNQALSAYNEAISLNPQLERAYLQRGITYQTKGNYDQALQDFAEAIRLNEGLKRAYYHQGVSLYYQKKYPQAIKSLTRAIQSEPAYDQAYFRRGLLYTELAQIEEQPESLLKKAVADFSMAIKLVPSKAHYYLARSKVYYRLGETSLFKLDRVRAREITQ